MVVSSILKKYSLNWFLTTRENLYQVISWNFYKMCQPFLILKDGENLLDLPPSGGPLTGENPGTQKRPESHGFVYPGASVHSVVFH